MKKFLLVLLVAGSLAACNDDSTSKTTEAKKDSIENKTDSLQNKVQVAADTTKDRMERKSDSLKAKVDQPKK
ncbi:MAG: hypothetical protein H0W12_11795 [Chitinophagaceae bacterium]|nr:hypothetical protein [Chitinophagaceae bacterium]